MQKLVVCLFGIRSKLWTHSAKVGTLLSSKFRRIHMTKKRLNCYKILSSWYGGSPYLLVGNSRTHAATVGTPLSYEDGYKQLQSFLLNSITAAIADRTSPSPAAMPAAGSAAGGAWSSPSAPGPPYPPPSPLPTAPGSTTVMDMLAMVALACLRVCNKFVIFLRQHCGV